MMIVTILNNSDNGGMEVAKIISSFWPNLGKVKVDIKSEPRSYS